MIDLYTGTPGSGKSLHCAELIYKRLSRGKSVIANFDINLTVFKKKKVGKFLYIDNSDLTPDFLMQYAVDNHKRNANGHIIEAQTLLVIDECQILFNSRDWQAKDRMRWATFFTQHRKYGYNIILITQFDRLIDRQIRSLVENEIKHRKVSNYKFFGFLLGLAFRGNLFVAVTYWYGVKERVSSEWFVLRPKYARIYDSYKIFGDTPAAGTAPARGPAADGSPKARISARKLKHILSALKKPKHVQPAPAPITTLGEFWTGEMDLQSTSEGVQ